MSVCANGSGVRSLVDLIWLITQLLHGGYDTVLKACFRLPLYKVVPNFLNYTYVSVCNGEKQ